MELSPNLKALGDAIISSVKEFVSRALDVRVGPMESKLDKNAAGLDSAERRLSRHADHLARLESRVKALEQK